MHDERGRAPTGEGHVCCRGADRSRGSSTARSTKLVGTIGDSTLLRGVMNVNGWNQYHIIARGPVLMQLMNGQLMAVALDEDAKHARPKGCSGSRCTSGRRSRSSSATCCIGKSRRSSYGLRPVVSFQ